MIDANMKEGESWEDWIQRINTCELCGRSTLWVGLYCPSGVVLSKLGRKTKTVICTRCAKSIAGMTTIGGMVYDAV